MLFTLMALLSLTLLQCAGLYEEESVDKDSILAPSTSAQSNRQFKGLKQKMHMLRMLSTENSEKSNEEMEKNIYGALFKIKVKNVSHYMAPPKVAN